MLEVGGLKQGGPQGPFPRVRGPRMKDVATFEPSALSPPL